MFNIFRNKNRQLNVLVLGVDGMLGSAVYKMFLDMQRRNGINSVVGLTYDELQTRYSGCIWQFFRGSRRFDWAVNCFAYTNVAKAQTMPGWQESYNGNAILPLEIARQCKLSGCKLVHISTDYVMSADVPGLPLFTPGCQPNPVNAYGVHKLIGEMNIQNTLPKRQYTILRTSWLYGMHGEKSFVHKLIDAVAKARATGQKDLYFTTCERSVPTSVRVVRTYIAHAVLGKDPLVPIQHAVCVTKYRTAPSRCDYASMIVEFARDEADASANNSDKFGDFAKALESVSICQDPEPYTKDGVFRPVMSALAATVPDGNGEAQQVCRYTWDVELKAFINANIGALNDYFNRRFDFHSKNAAAEKKD